MQNITLNLIAQYFNLGNAKYNDLQINGVAVDSRNVLPGYLFFALPGDQTDGHLYLASAAEKGAIAAVVLDDYSGPDFGMILFKSKDVLKSLQSLAKEYLKRLNVKVVGITGSIGKTTTKEFLYQLLKSKFHVAASPGNANSQVGLPLSILNNLDPKAEILIQEMGMDHPGNILKLVDIAPPHIAIVTSVSLVHACFFNSIDEIALAKGEIFSNPSTEIGFYHMESDYGNGLSFTGNCPKVSFSLSSNKADMFLSDNRLHSPFFSGDLAALNVPGVHNIQNLLAALGAAGFLGMTLHEINDAIKDLSLPEKRFEIVEKNGITFINDAYNASELSVKSALDSMPMPKGCGKKIAVLSDMRELGKFSKDCHLSVAKHALQKVDKMFCFGEESRHIFSVWQEAKRPVVWAKERQEIVSALKNQISVGDVVLFKGSNSMQVWKIMDEILV